MTLKLADFLRQSLRVAAHPAISLAEELALVGAFLGVEQVRFGERLRLQQNVEDDARDCRVPPLIIQPWWKMRSSTGSPSCRKAGSSGPPQRHGQSPLRRAGV